MSNDRIARLLERRDALDPAEEEALLAALAADPAAARRLARQFSTDEALSALLRPERGDLAARVRSALDSADSSRFVRVVRRRTIHRSRRGWLVAAGGALAAAAVLMWTLATPTPPPPPALAMPSQPAVLLRSEGATSAGSQLANGATLAGGTSITAGPGEAVLGFADDTTVHLAPGTMATVESTAPLRLRIDRGALRATVSPQPAGAPALVLTPHARATVIGTVLEVIAGDGATRLHVEHGKVNLATGAGTVDVATGASAVAAPDAAPVRLAPATGGVLTADPATAFLTGGGWSLQSDPAARGGVALVARAGIPFATPLDAATTWADLSVQVRGGVDYQLRIRARGEPGNEGVAVEVQGGLALKPGASPADPARAGWQRFTGFAALSTWRDDAEAPAFAHLPLRVRFARSGWAVLRLHPLAGDLRIEAIELVEVAP